MKILQIINSLSAGGAEIFMKNLSIELNKLPNTSVYVLTYAGVIDEVGSKIQVELENSNIIVNNLNIKRNFTKYKIPFKIHKVIEQLSPDIIHTHLDQTDLFTYLSLLKPTSNKPILIRTLHTNNLIKRIPLFLHKKVHNKYDLSVACGSSVETSFKFKEKLITINNGVPINNTINKVTIDNEPNTVKIVHIGSMNYVHNIMVKGQDILLKALALLPNDYLQRIKCEFLGDGINMQLYKDLAKEFGIEEIVDFPGRVGNVNERINYSDLAIFPSRFEGLPIATIECCIVGLPIIASNIEAFKVFSTTSTILFNQEDENDLKSKIIQIVDNFDKYKKHAIENIDVYKKKFDIKETARTYFKQYTKLLSNEKTIPHIF